MAALASAVAAVALSLPGFHVLGAGPAGGTILQGTFPGTQRPGLVYLPPHYRRASRYPVVYLLHGMPGTPTEFLGGTQLAQFGDLGVVSGTIRPFVAVMPAAGSDVHYDGEWAGPWEDALVQRIVPWVDAHLSTVRSAAGRVIAGLSAGGYGAVDIGLRHPGVFGTVEGWGGYYRPLRDGPFQNASPQTLAAHDPSQLVRAEASRLRLDRTRFFVSTGPSHSHWFTADETFVFVRELRSLHLPVTTLVRTDPHGAWRTQLVEGLTWALGTRS